MSETIALDLSCPKCGGDVTLRRSDWPSVVNADGSPAPADHPALHKATWQCPYCKAENEGGFVGRFAWVKRRSGASGPSTPVEDKDDIHLTDDELQRLRSLASRTPPGALSELARASGARKYGQPDDESPEITDEEWAAMRPGQHFYPAVFATAARPMNLHVDVRPSDEGGGFTCEVRELVNGAPAGPLHAFGKGPTKDQAREAAIGSTHDPVVRRAIGEGSEDLE